VKPKNFKRKLNLNKKTVVDLNTGEMKNVFGKGALKSQTITGCDCVVICLEPTYTCETCNGVTCIGETCPTSGGPTVVCCVQP
jgi:hypothetical protein